MFSKKTLETVMDIFKREKRVFSNEAQFQFEFGRALEKELKNEKYRILFEVLSVNKTEDNAKRKKIYTDLVVELGNNEYVAIELKYKSAGKPSASISGYDEELNAFKYLDNNNAEQLVFPQGAEDEGMCSFWKDIERLEAFRNERIPFNLDNKKKVTQAYAIIMANSKERSKSAYWAKHGGACRDFSLEKFSVIGHDAALQWHNSKRHENDASIIIKGTYTCEWKDYYDDHEFPIKYMIMEVN